MRYIDLIEAVEFSGLISRASTAVTNDIEKFIKNKVIDWTNEAIRERRKKLGYHPYKNEEKGFKSFDQEEFDQQNTNWSPTSDWIGDNLHSTLIPDPSNGGSNIVYALMNIVSNSLTVATREYIKQKFGDPVLLYNGSITRKVDDIYISVWYKTRADSGEYLGMYRSRDAHANGERTTLEIIVNRRDWADWLRNEISAEISYDGNEIDRFVDNIMNTFIHEYTHLEQDIRGRIGSLSLIPDKGSRSSIFRKRSNDNNLSQDDQEKQKTRDGVLYLSKVSEIDAHATASAGGTVARIMNSFAKHGKRYNPNWSASDINDEDWNEAIKDSLDYIYGNIDFGDLTKYIGQLNQENLGLDLNLKRKFIDKVKKKFIRTYVTRLQSYLRPIDGKKPALNLDPNRLPKE